MYKRVIMYKRVRMYKREVRKCACKCVSVQVRGVRTLASCPDLCSARGHSSNEDKNMTVSVLDDIGTCWYYLNLCVEQKSDHVRR